MSKDLGSKLLRDVLKSGIASSCGTSVSAF